MSMRPKLLVLAVVLGALTLALVATVAVGNESRRARATLSGYEEVPTLSVPGHGRFDATIDDSTSTIHFTLTYAAMTSTVTQAHIHLGQRATNGGVSAFLCGGSTKPACP